MNAIRRALDLIFYNKDWFRYIAARRIKYADDSLLRFRLRNGLKVEVRADARFVLNEIFLDRVYDVDGLDWGSMRNILDLGGNMGLFALYAWSRARDATIHSFEPEPGNAALFRRNIDQNNAPVKLHQVAVSDKTGVVRFSIGGNSAEYKLAREDDEDTIEVEAITPTQMFDLIDADEIDFAKIDIEGGERGLFAACTDDQLRRFKAIAIEWHYQVPELEELAMRFRDAGFDAQPVLIDHIRYLKAIRRDA